VASTSTAPGRSPCVVRRGNKQGSSVGQLSGVLGSVLWQLSR
jgi:hypothetical protein